MINLANFRNLQRRKTPAKRYNMAQGLRELEQKATKELKGLDGKPKAELEEVNEWITALKNEIERLTREQAAQSGDPLLDLNDGQKVKKWYEDRSRGPAGSPLTAKQALSDEVRRQLRAGTASEYNLRDPTVQEQLIYYKEVGDRSGDHGSDFKVISKAENFSEGSPLEWKAFERNFIEAIKNRDVSEADLKTVFVSRLKGPAKMFYLSIHGIDNMAFGDILELFRERYKVGKIPTQEQINQIVQKPNEKVEDFIARLKVLAHGVLPREPSDLKTWVTASNIVFVIPNPILLEENTTFQKLRKTAENDLIAPVLKNTTKDIQDSLEKKMYTDFSVLVEAVKAAEWFNKTVGPPKSRKNYHVKEESSESSEDENSDVNAMQKKGKGKGQRKGQKAPQKNKFVPKVEKKGYSQDPQLRGACYKCNQMGHWAANCPVLQTRERFKKWYQDSTPRTHKRTNRKAPETRKWMVKKRTSLRLRKKVNNLEVSDEELELCNLEAEMSEDEFNEYAEEVERCIEDSKNE